MTLLAIRYDKSVDGYIEVTSKKGDVLFSGMVASGATFLVDGVVNFSDSKDTLGSKITLWVNGVEHTTLHTSCSVPIGPGTKAGDFIVIFGFSRNTGTLPLCETGPIPPPGGID